MALGLAACGTDPTTVDYFGMTYDELQSSMEQEVSALVGLTDDNRTCLSLIHIWEETLAERCVVAGETIGKIDYPWCLGQVLRLLWIE